MIEDYFTKLRCEIQELDGEATVLGKIQRKVGKGQSETLEEELLGLPRLPRAARRKSGTKPLRISYPGATLTTVAIWR